MIEAMACGTPVVAWDRGAVPEIVEDGVSGFVVRSHEEALQAIRQLKSVNRMRVRRVFERRFSASAMARRYLEVYARLLRGAACEGTFKDAV
jgi:glycosyltransferase involved in cell wall biosynthesis